MRQFRTSGSAGGGRSGLPARPTPIPIVEPYCLPVLRSARSEASFREACRAGCRRDACAPGTPRSRDAALPGLRNLYSAEHRISNIEYRS